MDELIKIASNGQWTLEKAKITQADAMRMVQEFQAKKAAAAVPKPAGPPMTSMPQGMKPAAIGTGSNPVMDKEKVAALRAGYDRGQTAAPAYTPPVTAPKPSHGDKVAAKLSNEQAAADEKGKVKSGNKAAWEAGVAFLAQHGNKGYQALSEQMQQRKMLDAAHEGQKMPVKPKLNTANLQRPIEMTQDAKGNRVTQERQGKFHGEGAETTGKVIERPMIYEDENGEKKRRMVTSQEKHLWAWDHNGKKWNHVKTKYEGGGIGNGSSSTGEQSRPKAGSKEALFPVKEKED